MAGPFPQITAFLEKCQQVWEMLSEHPKTSLSILLPVIKELAETKAKEASLNQELNQNIVQLKQEVQYAEEVGRLLAKYAEKDPADINLDVWGIGEWHPINGIANSRSAVIAVCRRFTNPGEK